MVQHRLFVIIVILANVVKLVNVHYQLSLRLMMVMMTMMTMMIMMLMAMLLINSSGKQLGWGHRYFFIIITTLPFSEGHDIEGHDVDVGDDDDDDGDDGDDGDDDPDGNAVDKQFRQAVGRLKPNA